MNDYENTPIDSNIFASFFDKDYRLVKEHEFRRAIFRSKFNFSVTFKFLNLTCLLNRWSDKRFKRSCMEIFIQVLLVQLNAKVCRIFIFKKF